MMLDPLNLKRSALTFLARLNHPLKIHAFTLAVLLLLGAAITGLMLAAEATRLLPSPGASAPVALPPPPGEEAVPSRSSGDALTFLSLGSVLLFFVLGSIIVYHLLHREITSLVRYAVDQRLLDEGGERT